MQFPARSHFSDGGIAHEHDDDRPCHNREKPDEAGHGNPDPVSRQSDDAAPRSRPRAREDGRSADRRAPEPRLRSRQRQSRRDRAHAVASVAVQPSRARAGRVDVARRALRKDHGRLQQHPRRREEHGRAGRGRPHRHVRAPREHVAESHARRHRGPLRQGQAGLSRRRQGFEGPDRARAADPPGVPRLSRRAEGVRGARAASAESSRGGAASGADEAQVGRGGRRASLRRRSRRAREARAQARRGAAQRASAPRTAIRSARTSRTT